VFSSRMIRVKAIISQLANIHYRVFSIRKFHQRIILVHSV
jgi:hypothetical protein